MIYIILNLHASDPHSAGFSPPPVYVPFSVEIFDIFQLFKTLNLSTNKRSGTPLSNHSPTSVNFVCFKTVKLNFEYVKCSMEAGRKSDAG